MKNGMDCKKVGMAALAAALAFGTIPFGASAAEAAHRVRRNDPDADGLSTKREARLGTNPMAADTDGDGLDDGTEVKVVKSDPLATDSDNDAIEDGDEVSMGTDPSDADTDDDNLSDSEEILDGTNPVVADSDDDGVDDGAEIEDGTDPNNPDSDDDGISDGDEAENEDSCAPGTTCTDDDSGETEDD